LRRYPIVFLLAGVHDTRLILGVEQMMGAVAERLAQKIGIELLHVFVVVGIARHAPFVIGIQSLGARGANGIGDAVGLAAAADASAGAGHDFDEMPGNFVAVFLGFTNGF